MLQTRIITALVLLAFFIPALFYLPNLIWAILMLAITALAAHEWAILSGVKVNLAAIFTLAFVALICSHIYVLYADGFHVFSNKAFLLYAIATMFWVLLVPVWVARRFTLNNQVIKLLIGLGVLTAFWMALVSTKYMNPYLLLIVSSVIWIADSAAYFAGKRFGQHKLAPHVSPGKTWEGVAGALLAVAIFASVLKMTQLPDTWLIVPGLCFIAMIGVYGDLFESLMKRQANMKDSGDILPGHGGILDRVDGLISAMPVAMILLYGYIYYANTLTMAA